MRSGLVLEVLYPSDVLNTIVTHTNSTHFVVAYSGGIDSVVLLHLMATLRKERPDWQLSAVHVNHGLQSCAGDWQQHCESVCEKLHVPLISCNVTVTITPGDSVEAKARDARYGAIAELLTEDACLLTGHNQDDQAETLLLQLMRGAGVKGLAAMPVLKLFAQAVCLRPLLSVSRLAIEHYAANNQLAWIDDDSNQSLRFDRNYIRHQVMPLLQQRWPSVKKTIARSAQHCATTDLLVSDVALMDFTIIKTANECKINIVKLLELAPYRQENVLRYWIAGLVGGVPSEKQLREIIDHCILARQDANPKVTILAHDFRRYRTYLYCLPPMPIVDRSWQVSWDMQNSLELPYQLGFLQPADQGLEGALQSGVTVTVQFRRGGEVVSLGEKKYPLKDWFQLQGVPTWWRDRFPIVCLAGLSFVSIRYAQTLL